MSVINYIVKATEKNKIFRDVFNMQSIRFPTRLCLCCVVSYHLFSFHGSVRPKSYGYVVSRRE
jgi:hypothetical protein